MLIERDDGNVIVPKMSQVSTRTMEFCRRWGSAEEVKRAGWPQTHPGDFVTSRPWSDRRFSGKSLPPTQSKAI